MARSRLTPESFQFLGRLITHEETLPANRLSREDHEIASTDPNCLSAMQIGRNKNVACQNAESRFQEPMLTIRVAAIADAALIVRLIVELAAYDGELDQVRTTEADIARDGFGPNAQFRTLISEWCGEPVSFAVFFSYYSTWRGAGLYLEDLFVRRDFRRHGIGTALVAQVARTAEQEGRLFLRWTVLNWNQLAIPMYKALGADILDDWRVVQLTGESLRKLAAQDEPK